MFISHKYEFVLATPTKTGTNSMRQLAARWEDAGLPLEVFDKSRDANALHRMAPPADCYGYRRAILMRDPLDRLVSMFEYLRRRKGEWMNGELADVEEATGPEAAWLHLLESIDSIRGEAHYYKGGMRGVHGKRPYQWTDSLVEMVRHFAGVDADGSTLPWHPADGIGQVMNTIWIDSPDGFARSWEEFLEGMGVSSLDISLLRDVGHVNKTPDSKRLFDSTDAYLNVAGAWDLVIDMNIGHQLSM